MAVNSHRFYRVILVHVLLFVVPDWVQGLSRQEYAWVETYDGLSQRWTQDTEDCTDVSGITARCTVRCR